MKCLGDPAAPASIHMSMGYYFITVDQQSNVDKWQVIASNTTLVLLTLSPLYVSFIFLGLCTDAPRSVMKVI